MTVAFRVDKENLFEAMMGHCGVEGVPVTIGSAKEEEGGFLGIADFCDPGRNGL